MTIEHVYCMTIYIRKEDLNIWNRMPNIKICSD